MNYSPDKGMNQFLQMAARTGWKIVAAKGGHWKLKAPNGGITFTSSTPRDHNAPRMAQRELKKVWPEWQPEGTQHIKKAKRPPSP